MSQEIKYTYTVIIDGIEYNGSILAINEKNAYDDIVEFYVFEHGVEPFEVTIKEIKAI